MTTASDFGSPTPLMIDVGRTSACTNIETVDDQIFEEGEVFLVLLSPLMTSVTINNSFTTVQIIDNDGRFKFFNVVPKLQ